MAELKQVMAYLCEQYPHKDELSKARLTKLVYLADWRSSILRQCQITTINWVFNHFGPYVDDIIALARSDGDFEVVKAATMFGEVKEVIRVREGVLRPLLNPQEKEILDFVIDSTKSMFWNAFIRLVYSTYPILSKPRFSQLNLVSIAQEYKNKCQTESK